LLAFLEKLPPRLIGIEACATSHYWARELASLGHVSCRSAQARTKVRLRDRVNHNEWP
jgi:transposase